SDRDCGGEFRANGDFGGNYAGRHADSGAAEVSGCEFRFVRGSSDCHGVCGGRARRGWAVHDRGCGGGVGVISGVLGYSERPEGLSHHTPGKTKWLFVSVTCDRSTEPRSPCSSIPCENDLGIGGSVATTLTPPVAGHSFDR